MGLIGSHLSPSERESDGKVRQMGAGGARWAILAKADDIHTDNVRLYALQLHDMSYNWGIFLARGRTRTQHSTVADDQVARGHLIGQILQMWQLSQQQSSNRDS